MYIGLRVKYPLLFLSDCHEISPFLDRLSNNKKYQISWKSAQWEPRCCTRAEDRQTEEQTWRI